MHGEYSQMKISRMFECIIVPFYYVINVNVLGQTGYCYFYFT